MAYYYDRNLALKDPNEDEEDFSTQLSGSTGSEAQTPSGSTGGGPQGNASQKPFETGSSFHNIDKYLNANLPQQFGQKVQGRVEDTIKKGQEGIDKGYDKFKTDLAGQQNNPTQAQIDNDISDPGNANVSQFRKWLYDPYSGYRSLSEDKPAWNDFYSGLDKAKTESNLYGTEGGRFTLLDQYYGKPSYSTGQKSLDNLLIQQGGTDVNKPRMQAAELERQAGNKDIELSGLAGKAVGDYDVGQGVARSAIGVDANHNVLEGDKAGAIGKEYKTLEDLLANTNAQRGRDIDQFTSDLNAHQFTDPEFTNTGLKAGDPYYNLNLNDYYQPGTRTVGYGAVLTKAEKDRLNALTNLADVSNKFGAYSPETAPSEYGFNLGAFYDAQNATRSAYDADKSTNIEQWANWLPNNLRDNNGTGNFPNTQVFSGAPPVNSKAEDWMPWAASKLPLWNDLASNASPGPYNGYNDPDVQAAIEMKQIFEPLLKTWSTYGPKYGLGNTIGRRG